MPSCRNGSPNLHPKVPAHAVLLSPAGGVYRLHRRGITMGITMRKRITAGKVLLAYVLAQVIWLVVLTQYRPG